MLTLTLETNTKDEYRLLVSILKGVSNSLTARAMGKGEQRTYVIVAGVEEKNLSPYILTQLSNISSDFLLKAATYDS